MTSYKKIEKGQQGLQVEEFPITGYKYQIADAVGVPGSGIAIVNDSDLSLITDMRIHKTNFEGQPITSELAKLVSGDNVYLKGIEFPDASAIYQIVTTVDSGVDYTFTLTLVDAGSNTTLDTSSGIEFHAAVTAVSTDGIIGGVTLSSSSNTNILNGTYVILADTTTVTSVTSGIGQGSNWTLEITQAGITNQKGAVTATVNLEKDGGGGANYDIAIFKNGSIIAESEQVDQKLESGGKGQSVTVMSIVEFSTSDTFSLRVSGNGTADDIFCGGGTLFIR